MVFLSLLRYGLDKNPNRIGPDRFWRKRKILRQSAHFYGRKRNCYRIAVRYVHKAWQYVRVARDLRKENMKKLWTQRLTAACEEHDVTYEDFSQGLLHVDVLLNKKVLSELAAYEPRTFKSLANFSSAVAKSEGLNDIKKLSAPPPPGVYIKNLIKNQ